MHFIDLNCDMGESFGHYSLGNDSEIIKHVSSVNIACGYHAGDPKTMEQTVKLAIKHGVKIGAHPGLPDLNGFGRRKMAISPKEAYQLTIYQIGALLAFVQAAGETLHHVKPHGALYNMAANDAKLAESIALAIKHVNPNLVLYGLSGSELTKAGEKLGLTVAHEVFADRTYQADGSLTPRTHPNAIITNQEEAAQQVEQMVTERTVTTMDGQQTPINADTICIHGDHPNAVSFAKFLQRHLSKSGIKIANRR